MNVQNNQSIEAFLVHAVRGLALTYFNTLFTLSTVAIVYCNICQYLYDRTNNRKRLLIYPTETLETSLGKLFLPTILHFLIHRSAC